MSSALPQLYIQCNPLLDVSAPVTDDFLLRYKVSKGAASLLSEEQANIFADMEKEFPITYVPGGSGLNTARVAQWISQAPSGSFTNYVGCIADDKYGIILKEAAEKDGVTMHLEYTAKAATGSCAVCISGKERSLIANLAAANCLSPAHMQSTAVTQAMQAARLFYLTGFTLTIDVEYVLQVAAAARANGGKFMLNLSAPFLLQFFTENFNKVVPFLDVIFGNAEEAKTLAAVMKWDVEGTAEIAKKAAAALPYTGSHDRLVVFTDGSDPTIYVTAGGQSGEVPVKPIAPESIVDLNGAGDAFVGGFLAAYAAGRDLDRCCEVGNYAAGVVIQHDGCTYPEKPAMTP